MDRSSRRILKEGGFRMKINFKHPKIQALTCKEFKKLNKVRVGE